MTVSAPPSARTATRLDAVDVHRDAGDVAGQPDARCRSAETSICSPMLEPLKSSVSSAGLAVDDVAAVARVPLEACRCRRRARRCRRRCCRRRGRRRCRRAAGRRRRRRAACRRRRRRRASARVSVPMPFWPAIVSLPSRPWTTSSLDRGVVQQPRAPGRTSRHGACRRGRCRSGRRRRCRCRSAVSVPVAAVDVTRAAPVDADAGVDRVVAAERVDGGRCPARPRRRSRARRGRGRTMSAVARSEPTSTSSAPSVPCDDRRCRPRRRRCRRTRRGRRRRCDVGAREVADGHGVGAAERRGRRAPRRRRASMRDRGDVAGEAHARAVGRRRRSARRRWSR